MTRLILTWLVPPAVLAAFAGRAIAQDLPLCDDLNLPNVIYGAGGSAITPTLRQVAPYLATLPDPVNLVFSDPSACGGYAAFLGNAVTTTFRYWGTDGVERQCQPRAGGQPVDFAHMGNPAGLCPGQNLPADVFDLQAPVQTLNFIVDRDSTQLAISANALYFILGFGAAGGVQPWTQTDHLLRRSPSSFAHLFAAAAVGLPATSFVAGTTEASNNGDVITRLVQYGETNPETPLGYVAGSTADGARALVRTLAFQASNADCAFLPDSSAGSFDKANVRNGNYALWTPGHFFFRVDPESGVPRQPRVPEVLGWITGDTTGEALAEVTARVIRAGDIPQCAMHVRREGLLGPVQPFAPPVACDCFFEQTATGQAPPGCSTCTTAADCSGGSRCSFGFCEPAAPALSEGGPTEQAAASAQCSASFDDAARLPHFVGGGGPLPPLPAAP